MLKDPKSLMYPLIMKYVLRFLITAKFHTRMDGEGKVIEKCNVATVPSIPLGKHVWYLCFHLYHLIQNNNNNDKYSS